MNTGFRLTSEKIANLRDIELRQFSDKFTTKLNQFQAKS